MRVAELVMAIVLAVFSLAIMYKATELPIGWIVGSGPGPGAFPFWLSAGMLVCCGAIVIRWWRRTSPPSRSEEPYFDQRSLQLFLVGAVPLAIMIGLFHVIGVYFALPLYLAYYVRFVGNHKWWLTLTIALTTPVVTFLFCEIALKIELPKGFSEELFYPIYDLFY
jgi:putative tricarboxylic transport membrane protein